MSHRNLTPTVVLGAVLAVASSAGAFAQNGNPQRGLEKSQVCQSCHGRTGNETLLES